MPDSQKYGFLSRYALIVPLLTGNLRDNLNQERADDDPIADRDLVNIAPLRWISIAHCATSNALPNSTRNASPNCFYFSAVKPGKDFPKQPAMFV